MHAIRLLCPRALLFRQGRLELGGPSEEVIARHHELLSVDATAGTDESSGAGASLVERTLVDATGAVAHHPRQGDHLTYRARLRFHQARKSTRLNSSHYCAHRMPPSACKKKKKRPSLQSTTYCKPRI